MTDATQLDRLQRMLKARRFEERLIVEGSRVSGLFHVAIGQEATAAAIAGLRRAGDVLMLNHRNHEHLVANGAALDVLYAEIFGLDRGPLRGRGGSLHLSDPGVGVPYTSAMVGGSTPLGLGYALAIKRQGREGVSFCCFGDGAMNEGVLHECLNVARLWELPVVFVCESNAERVGDHANANQAAREITDLAEANQIAASKVNAWEPEEVDQTFVRAVDAARRGGGPRFVLAETVPWPGNDSFFYPELIDGPLDVSRATSPPKGWEAFDPVLNEVRRLLADGVTVEAVREVDQAVTLEVEAAAEAAITSPPAPASAASEDVWSFG
jgi:TPP-dependent pyruvate/acetoin dehydrogenase alpha subunit